MDRNTESNAQWVIVIVAALTIFFLGYIVFSNNGTIAELKTVISYKHQENAALENSIAQDKIRVDSLSTVILDMQRDWELRQIALEKHLKQKYDEKRNHIKYMPIDDNIEFLSEWLSEIADSRDRYDCGGYDCTDEGFEPSKD